MADPSSFTHHVVARLMATFCRATDSVTQKRRQGLVVGMAAFSVVTTTISIIFGIVFGVFLQVQWRSSVFLFAADVFALVCCWRTKTPTVGGRVLMSFALATSWYGLYSRGGFSYTSGSVFVGMAAPMLSTLLCDRAVEQAFWVIAYLVGNTTILVLDVNAGLPAVVPRYTSVALYNTAGLAPLVIFYIALFKFMAHLYTLELETRFSLEKELSLFMRLSHEIRTPLSILIGNLDLLSEENFSGEKRLMISDMATAARRLQKQCCR